MPAPSPEMIEQVRALRGLGLTLGQIGQQLGVSKGTVCGLWRRHVLGIGLSPRAPRTRAAPATTAARRRRPGGAREAVEALRALAGSNGPASCQFPLGEPRTRSFRFCGERVVTGRSYCHRHMAVCYRPVRDAGGHP